MDFNGYAVRLPGGVVLIDPIYGDESLWEELAALGPNKILLTNKDHERASDELRKRLKIPIAIHDAEVKLLSVAPDESFADGAMLAVSLQAVRFENMKSPAECAFYWPDRKALFVGDAVTGHPAGSIGLVKKHEGKPEVIEELKKLLALDFDTLFVGDGEPLLTGAKTTLKEFLEKTVS